MDDAIHDKIVDYLMQYRSKIPNTCDLSDKYAIAEKSRMLIQLDLLIHAIDRYAVIDSKGWIK
jgi:hypothetical protein